jgi:hypothetical protein
MPPALQSAKFQEPLWECYNIPETVPLVGQQFSVACFNVLFNSEVANPHSSPEHISKFPSFADMTDHPKRRPYILEMLGIHSLFVVIPDTPEKTNVDILALQEVTPDFYEDLLAQEWYTSLNSQQSLMDFRLGSEIHITSPILIFKV